MILHLYGYAVEELVNRTPLTEHVQEDLYQQQYALRRAAVRAMQRYYHQTPENQDTWDNVAWANGYNSFEVYSNRMFLPSLGDEVAWANADAEGKFIAEILGRPLVVVRNDNQVNIYFSATTLLVDKIFLFNLLPFI